MTSCFHFHFLSKGVSARGRPLHRARPGCFCRFFQTAAVHHSGSRATVRRPITARRMDSQTQTEKVWPISREVWRLLDQVGHALFVSPCWSSQGTVASIHWFFLIFCHPAQRGKRFVPKWNLSPISRRLVTLLPTQTILISLLLGVEAHPAERNVHPRNPRWWNHRDVAVGALKVLWQEVRICAL